MDGDGGQRTENITEQTSCRHKQKLLGSRENRELGLHISKNYEGIEEAFSLLDGAENSRVEEQSKRTWFWCSGTETLISAQQ